MNGFTALPNTISQYAGQGFLGQMQLTHAQVLGMFSGVNGRTNGFIHGHPLVANSIKAPQNGDVGKVATNPSPDAGHDSEAALSQTMTSSAPSLSAGVQPSGSMPSEKLANPKKHPDLALQLWRQLAIDIVQLSAVLDWKHDSESQLLESLFSASAMLMDIVAAHWVVLREN
jgi:hypothetical protein